MQNVKVVKTVSGNWFNLGAWLLLAGCLSSLLIYGLSFMLSKPTVETITVKPSNEIINDNQTQQIKFQHRTKRH